MSHHRPTVYDTISESKDSLGTVLSAVSEPSLLYDGHLAALQICDKGGRFLQDASIEATHRKCGQAPMAIV